MGDFSFIPQVPAYDIKRDPIKPHQNGGSKPQPYDIKRNPIKSI